MASRPQRASRPVLGRSSVLRSVWSHDEAVAPGQAARFRAMGFQNVKALKGGVEAWQQAGYPIAA